MEVRIESGFEKLVEEKVRSGRYQDAQDVVYEALTLLRDRDEQESAEIRLALDEARQQSLRGEGTPAKELFDELREQYGIPRDNTSAG